MGAGWLPDNPETLASDPDLRAVQVQWLWDTLRMRRITFGISIACVPINLLVIIFAPQAAAVTLPVSAGAGIIAAVAEVARRHGQRRDPSRPT